LGQAEVKTRVIDQQQAGWATRCYLGRTAVEQPSKELISFGDFPKTQHGQVPPLRQLLLP
jgi:hypothetical protein